MARMKTDSVPTLVLLGRTESWKIHSLTAIHHLFLTPEVVEKRKPLSAHARRAGWIGCNIRLDLIGTDSRIPIIESGAAIEKKRTRERFRKFQRLNQVPVRLRGWATLTLRTIRELQQPEFSLVELYTREAEFAARYPHNRNIKPKIRQQLQVLRDLGLLEFTGPGHYRLLV